MEEIHVCKHCGGSNVYRKVLVSINGANVVQTDDYWCSDCVEDTKAISYNRFVKDTIKDFVLWYLEAYGNEEQINWLDQVGAGCYNEKQEKILCDISSCVHPMTALADRYFDFCRYKMYGN